MGKTKIIIVHSYFDLSFEEDEILKSVREQFLVNLLIENNVCAEHCMLTSRNVISRANNLSKSLLFPIDKLDVKRGIFYSSSLVDYLKDYKPDLILFKGMGFKLPYQIYFRLNWRCNIGFIQGGQDVDFLSPISKIIYTESPIQSNRLPRVTDHCYHQYLPKLVPQERLMVNVEPFDIVAIGNFIPLKNFKILRIIPQKYSICLIGDGPLRDQLIDDFKNNKNIKVIGKLEHLKALEYIAAAKILVHPSVNEGVPRVVYEALSQGIPVIGYRGVLDHAIIDGSEGILVHSDETLIAAIEFLLSDDSVYQSFKDRALNFSKKYLSNDQFRLIIEDLIRYVNDLKSNNRNKRYFYHFLVLVNIRTIFILDNYIFYILKLKVNTKDSLLGIKHLINKVFIFLNQA